MTKFHTNRITILVVFALLGITATASIGIVGHKYQVQDERTEFLRSADNLQTAIQTSIDRHTATIVDIGALLTLNENSSRTDFTVMWQTISGGEGQAGVRAISWNPAVRGDERKNYVDAAIQDGYTKFEFRERDEYGALVQASERPEYFPVFYIEPFGGNESAFGFDLGSNEQRLSAIRKADVIGRPVATEPIDLVQRTDNAFGYLVINPVRSVRSKELLGYTVGVFDIDQSILTLSEMRQGDNFEFDITDADPNYPDVLMSGSTDGEFAFGSRQFQTESESEIYSITLPQREWVLRVSPTGKGIGVGAVTWVPVVMGILLTIAMITYINSQINLRKTVQRKVSEQTAALANSNQRLSFLEARTKGAIDAAEEGYLLVDHERNIIWLNPSFKAMFGLPGRNWTDTHSSELLDNAEHNLIDPEKFAREIRDIYRSTTTVVSDQIVETSNPKNRWLSRSSVPIFGPDRKYLGRLWTYRDVTKSLAAESAKSEFVSVVSHELRTPLTSIKGALSLIAAGISVPDKFDTPKMLDIALRNTDRLVRLINDILDIEKFQAGKLEANFSRINLVEVLNNSIEELVGLSQANQVNIVLETEQDHVSIVGDADRLAQVLANLIGNSIKFSPEGGVVAIETTLSEDSVKVTISDEGPGIKPEDHSLIFESFRQSDSSDSRAKSGSGLGLAIAKNIIELHSGSIWVESTLGHGSEFSFEIPVVPPIRENDSQAASEEFLGLAG